MRVTLAAVSLGLVGLADVVLYLTGDAGEYGGSGLTSRSSAPP